jgi:hypothetical protein
MTCCDNCQKAINWRGRMKLHFSITDEYELCEGCALLIVGPGLGNSRLSPQFTRRLRKSLANKKELAK